MGPSINECNMRSLSVPFIVEGSAARIHITRSTSVSHVPLVHDQIPELLVVLQNRRTNRFVGTASGVRFFNVVCQRVLADVVEQRSKQDGAQVLFIHDLGGTRD